MLISRKYYKKIIFVLFIIILVGAIMYYNCDKTDQSLFNNVEKLNQYINLHTHCVISDVKLENKNISGLRMTNGIIKKMGWEKVDMNHSNIDNSIIEDSIFIDVNFNNSKFKNVIFKNVKFISTVAQGGLLLDIAWFDDSELKNVSFINCAFGGEVKLRRLQNSDINIINSKLISTDFNDSEIKLNIKNSDLNNITIMGAKPTSDFIMQGGKLDADFFQAHFNEFKLDGVKTNDVGLNEAQVTKITLENSELDFGMYYAKAQNIDLKNNRIYDFGATNGTYENISIHNCKNASGIGLEGSKIQKLTIENCNTKDFDFYEAKVNKFSLKNFTFHCSSSAKVMINSAIFDNVHMRGDIDLTNITIKNLYIHDFHYDPNAKVKTDGSNLECNAHGLKLKGIWPEVTPDNWLIFRWKGRS